LVGNHSGQTKRMSIVV